MAREKAYGLSKKAPSRIKKKIGRQALRKKKHVSSQQSVVRCKLQVACCPGQVIGSSSDPFLYIVSSLCSVSAVHLAPCAFYLVLLSSRDHRDQIDLRVVRDQGRFEMRF